MGPVLMRPQVKTMIKNRKSMAWRLILPVPLVMLLLMVLAATAMPLFFVDKAQDDAVRTALRTVEQFKQLRKYYTENVISKVLASGALVPASDHAGDPLKIPLPATVIHDMSRLLAGQDTKITLFSPYPFPGRTDRRLDDFQQAAWTFLADNPDKTFVRREVFDGRQIVRVAMSDIMISEACVACHNSHPGSPKTDWKLGQVRGVLEVDSAIENELATGQQLSHTFLLALLVGAALVIGLLIFLIRHLVVNRLAKLSEVAARMTLGDMTVRVPASSDDEIGELGAAFNHMAASVQETLRVKERLTQQEAEAKRAQELDHHLAQMSDHIAAVAGGDLSGRLELKDCDGPLRTLALSLNVMTANLADITSGIYGSSDAINLSMGRVISAMRDQAAGTSRQANHVSEINRNLNQLATTARATMVQASTLGDAAKNTVLESKQGEQSVVQSIEAMLGIRDAASAGAMSVNALSEQIQRVGQITQTLQMLAQQSKMLALNAAIEAAKSGKAGVGFSAVAAEVKDLATQSESATVEVQGLLDDISTATKKAVTDVQSSVQGVDEGMSKIEQAGGTIKQLVETIQNSAAASFAIVDALHEEHSRIDVISQAMTELQAETQRFIKINDATSQAAEGLDTIAGELREKVGIYHL